MRSRFLRRAAAFLIFLFTLTVGILTVAFWVAVRLLNMLAVPHQWEGVARAVIFVVFGLTAAGLIAAVGAFRRIATPIGDIMAAASRVAEGDYTVRVSERGPEEIRRLGRAFNSMTERLQRHDEQRRTLLAEVSHELRTPLSVIQGNLEGLLDGVYPRDDTHLSAVLEETRVLSRLIEDLRTLALAESEGLRLVKAPTDLGELAAEMIGAFTPRADAAGVTMTLQVAQHLPQVTVDAERIRQVLSNLIDNALRYTPAGGSIQVSCLAQGDHHVVVSVADTGAGIRGEDLEHVFDRFYKTRDSRGAGLGLAIAKHLVRAHDGTITAQSTPQKGTTVSFTLPVGM